MRSAAARSLLLFGIYVVVVGLVLIAAPQSLVALLRLPPISSSWVRVIGLLALVIGAYDITAGRHDLHPCLAVSVPVRLLFAAGVAALVVFRQMPPSFLLFGAMDVAGAVWTTVALRAE